MNKILNLLVLAVKGFICVYLPVILLLFITYEIILGKSMQLDWDRIILYAAIIGAGTIRNYMHISMEENVKSFEYLKTVIEKGRWELIEQGEHSLLIKPTFDFPFRIFIKNTVQIRYANKVAIIEGPWFYANALASDIRGKSGIWTKRATGIGALLLIIAFVSIPVLEETGVIWNLKQSVHGSQIENVEIIEINPNDVLGNTIENTNNYGYGVENDEYMFYINDHLNLIRVNKNFQDKNYLIQKPGGTGISRLNITGDWIFYSSGKTLNRIKIDGTDNKTIYKLGYPLDIHMKENWIYFINHSDDSNVYRMDINGRNLDRFLEIQVLDIALYDDRLFFSYKKDGNGYVESICLDGSDRRIELNTLANDLTIKDGYYYFISEDYTLNRIEVGKNAPKETLVDERFHPI